MNSQDSKQKFADWLGFKTCGDPVLEKMVEGGLEWANAFKAKASPRWLSFVGKSGVGKTHIARRLWRWAAAKSQWSGTDFIAGEIYWPEFIQQLRAGNAFEKRDDMKRWPVLFLDDIGSERDSTGFATEELNTLIGCREGRWTLLTSNMDIAAIQKLDGRIASRLLRGNNICVGANTRDFSSRSTKTL